VAESWGFHVKKCECGSWGSVSHLRECKKKNEKKAKLQLKLGQRHVGWFKVRVVWLGGMQHMLTGKEYMEKRDNEARNGEMRQTGKEPT